MDDTTRDLLSRIQYMAMDRDRLRVELEIAKQERDLWRECARIQDAELAVLTNRESEEHHA